MRSQIALATLLGACTQTVTDDVRLPFTADPPLGADVTLCFGFDVEVLRGRSLRAIEVHSAQGPVTLHHVAFYATPDRAFPDGPVECSAMPEDATELHVSVPDRPSLGLPAGIAVALPADSARIVVQAHALRSRSGRAVPSEAVLRPGSGEVLAAWLAVRAPVPAIRPHTQETSAAGCRLEHELHVISTWPHMHALGERFVGTIVRATGEREPLVTVDPWSFDDQRAYEVNVTLGAGDILESECTWTNPTGDYVLAGPRLTDEMCGQSLVVWPAHAARCAE